MKSFGTIDSSKVIELATKGIQTITEQRQAYFDAEVAEVMRPKWYHKIDRSLFGPKTKAKAILYVAERDNRSPLYFVQWKHYGWRTLYRLTELLNAAKISKEMCLSIEDMNTLYRFL